MRQKYSGTKIAEGKPSYRFTVVASTPDEAKEIASSDMRNSEGYRIELDDEATPVPTFTPGEDFAARTGLRPSEWELRDGKPE